MFSFRFAIVLFLCSQAFAAPELYESGLASWYANKLQGQATASGEPYEIQKFTAAHRNLAFGTEVIVRNKINGKTVRVRINDRGPFVDGRIIDLSAAAASEIGLLRKGQIPVEIFLN